MSERRVVVTGIGFASPIGHDLETAGRALREGRSGVRRMPEWDSVEQLKTRLAAPITDIEFDFPRKKARSMGRVALLATWASERAIADAGLDPESLRAPSAGVAYGSTHGSSSASEAWMRKLIENGGFRGIQPAEYLKFMSHTTSANLATYYGVRGRVISTCAACVSGSQAVGAGYEAIRYGREELMLCGGAEELHFSHAGVFDVMYAASARYNDQPEASPRPFDRERDGLVVGEGAGSFVLESLEHAQARGARIYAELLGYGTNCDGTHVTNPSSAGMAGAMRAALEDAKVAPASIDYVNAHATATDVGDVAESEATAAVFGAEVPVSSTKGFTGHTLGACGVIEAAFSIAMMNEGWLAPNHNLQELDPRCAKLDYVRELRETGPLDRIMSNNFAFGGINTSLIFGAWREGRK